MSLSAVIVDDERLARVELCRLLEAAHPEIRIAGEARGAEDALALVSQLSPDLLFLDIEMPGMSGFELLERLEQVPRVIFTTGYDQYAIRAFEVNALDYLLKPIAPERLAAALARAHIWHLSLRVKVNSHQNGPGSSSQPTHLTLVVLSILTG